MWQSYGSAINKVVLVSMFRQPRKVTKIMRTKKAL